MASETHVAHAINGLFPRRGWGIFEGQPTAPEDIRRGIDSDPRNITDPPDGPLVLRPENRKGVSGSRLELSCHDRQTKVCDA